MLIKSYILGILLILLGVVSYFATGTNSITALIPAMFGLPVVVLSLTARNEKWHRHSIHSILVLALLGLAGTVSGVIKFVAMLGGTDIPRPSAAVAQTIMAVLCIWYLVYGVRSFITARRNRDLSAEKI